MGWALLAAVTLDGVPENLALGVSLVEGASVRLLVAIFFSNLPESLVGAVAMQDGAGPGQRWWRRGLRALGSSPCPWCPDGHSQVASDEVLAVALGFAGGAALASLADTLMPEAFEHGRPLNAFADGCRLLPLLRARRLTRRRRSEGGFTVM